MKKENRLRKILSEGKVAVGTCVDSYSPAAIEAVGFGGLDWVRVCNEYSWRRDESMEHMMRAAALVDLTAMIRVEKGDPYLISKAFQCGAGAFLVSDIATYEEALAVARAAKFPPKGHRGYSGYSFAGHWGADSGKEWVEWCDRELMVGVMIENEQVWYLGNRLGRTPMPEFVRALGTSWSTLFLVAFLALCIALAGLAFLGWLRGLLLRRGAHDFYVASYVLLLLVWVGGGFRLIMPILVFLFAYLYEGAVFLARSSAHAHGFGRSILVVSILANLLVTFEFPLIRDRLAGRYEPWWGDLLTATCKLGSVARSGETVIASPENVAFYFAGLQAGRLPERPTPEALLEAIFLSNADYLVTTDRYERSFSGPHSSERADLRAAFYPLSISRVIRTLTLRNNVGKGEAVRLGLLAAINFNPGYHTVLDMHPEYAS